MLSLDLDTLTVESFSTQGDPTQWAAGGHTTEARTCIGCTEPRYAVPPTYTPYCDDEPGVAAMTGLLGCI